MTNPPSLGTNVSEGAYWSTDFPYIDLMHQATDFFANTGVKLDLDSSGWVKSLPAGTWAGVYPILDNPAGPDTAGDHYVVMYDGDGTFQETLGATISRRLRWTVPFSPPRRTVPLVSITSYEPGRLRSRHPRGSGG